MALSLPGRRPSPVESYRKLWEQARKARLPYDREAWLNLMFWNGQQYVHLEE